MGEQEDVTPYYTDEAVTLYHGDNRDVLTTLPSNSVDACVTDPPYELGFMGRRWDSSGIAYDKYLWAEVWRVLKPGGHLLAFGGTRTWHRLAVAIEDAGFEVRDSIAWMYGSGFPKSLDVSKAIDKLDATEERRQRAVEFQSWLREHMKPQRVNELTGTDMGHHLTTHPTQPFVATAEMFDLLRPHLPKVPDRIEKLVQLRTVESENFKRREVIGNRTMPDSTKVRLGFVGEQYSGDDAGSVREVAVTEAHTPEAAKWQGWGTALKPAFEPIVVARKPLIGTVAENVQQYGTGALNIDGCRIGTEAITVNNYSERGPFGESQVGKGYESKTSAGRWPANVILDESQATELDRQSGVTSSGHRKAGEYGLMGYMGADAAPMPEIIGDTGGASRFFYTAKATSAERPNVNGVAHPTVKPLDLMRYLVRLVTPPGGTVLEPFAGSGTTAEACIVEGFKCIAIEMTDDYLPLIVQRITKPIEVTLL